MQALNEERLSPDKAVPYILQYYGAHLERTPCQPTTFLTLVSNGWKKAWEKLEGTYAGFLSDIDRTWRIAEDVDQKAAEDNLRIPHIGGEIRCALCHTSIHSLAANLPPAFLVELVEKNILTPVQAWNYAHHTSNQWQREETIVGLAPHLPESLLVEAFEEALKIEKNASRAEALLALLPRLSGAFKETALRETLQATQQTDNDFARARLLVRLAPHAQSKLQKVLQVAYAIKDGFSRAEALRELARHVPGEAAGKILQDALQAARSVDDEFHRVEALAELAPQFPDNLKERVLQEALDIVPAIDVDPFMADILVGMAPHLTVTASRKALEVARTIEEESYQVQALVGLASYSPTSARRHILKEAAQIIQTASRRQRLRALTYLGPYLKDSLIQKVLRTTQMLRENSRSVVLRNDFNQTLRVMREEDLHRLATEAFIRLTPYLSPNAKEEIVGELLQGIPSIKGVGFRVSALVALVPLLPVSLHRNALHMIQEIENEQGRARALASLAPHLAEPLLREALQDAITIGDKLSRSEASLDLASHLTGERKQRVVNRLSQDVGLIRDAFPDSKAPTLAESRPKKKSLPARVLQQALQEVLRIQDSLTRRRELAALLPHLPQDVRQEVLRQELRRVSMVKGSRRKVQAIGQLASCLSESLLDAALKIARDIEDNLYRAEALSMFIPLLPSPYKDRVLNEILQTLQTGKSRKIVESVVPIASLESTLRRVAPHISVTFSQKWLEVVNKFESPLLQVIATVTLASCLPAEPREKIMDAMLQIAQTFQDPRGRASAFAELAPHLLQAQKEEILREALQTAGKIEHEGFRIPVLAKLAPHLTKLPNHILYPVWRTTLHVLATRTRRAFVNDLAALSPVLFALGGTQAIEESIQAIEEVGQWWP